MEVVRRDCAGRWGSECVSAPLHLNQSSEDGVAQPTFLPCDGALVQAAHAVVQELVQ